MREPFSAALAAHRRRLGLSQHALDREAGFGDRYTSHLERGDVLPSRRTVLRLCGLLRLSPVERDRLLLAAGFAPIADTVVVIDARDEPQLAEVARRLRDGTPGERQRLRDALAAALVGAGVDACG